MRIPAPDSRPSGELSVLDGVALVGIAIVGAGVLLPWVEPTQLKVYVLGMESGVERFRARWVLLLGGLGSVACVARPWTPGWEGHIDAALLGIGCSMFALTVATSPLTSRWSAAIGVYVTLVGTVVLVGAVLARRLSADLLGRNAADRDVPE